MNASFRRGADLIKTRFRGPAVFAQVKADGGIGLNRAVFENSANFEAIEVGGIFSIARATFHRVPNFIGATFKGALRLDNVSMPRYRLTFGLTPDRNASALFRELKRHAVEAHDRDRELEFFAQEMRTERFYTKGLPYWVPRFWSWRFWFGLAYGTFSDFGRSVWRPLLFWLALLLGFAAFYLGEHEDMRRARLAINPEGGWNTLAYVVSTRDALTAPPQCSAQGKEGFASTDAVTEALNLSLANALVFDGGRANSSRRTYGCLFGFETAADQQYPRVSSRVSRASTVQSLASAVLIFLFLLAVRNLLRLK